MPSRVTIVSKIPRLVADGVMVGRLKLAECEDGFIWREALRWQ
jgi:hypothetical protein